MHMLRNDDPHFRAFGEIYFSGVGQGKVKGWYRHREKTLNYAVPSGAIRVVIYDDRAGSPTHGRLEEHRLGEGEADYALLTIPPLLWYCVQGLAPGVPSSPTVRTCPTIPPNRTASRPMRPMCPTAGPLSRNEPNLASGREVRYLGMPLPAHSRGG